MTARNRRLLPWLALLVVYVVWGSTYLAIRVVVLELPPFAAAGFRFLVAGLLMTGLAAWRDRAAGWPTRRQLGDYALVGVLLLSFGNALVMWAERTIPSGIAALIVASVPLWLTLFDGMRRGGQPWSARVWAGTAVGLIGVLFVARPSNGVDAGHWPGILALQLATLGWSAGSLYAQSIRRRVPLFTAAAIEMLAGGAVLLIESRLAREPLERFLTASTQAWLGLGYLVVFGSLVGFTAYALCLNELPASTVGTYAYVNPVVAVALGSAFLAEPLSGGVIIGGTLILLAVLLSTTGRRTEQARPVGSPEPATDP